MSDALANHRFSIIWSLLTLLGIGALRSLASCSPQAVPIENPKPAPEDRSIKLYLEYATGRNALLIHARINDKPVLLILDTGFPQTVLQPKVLGIKPAESPQEKESYAARALKSNGVSRQVELEVGEMSWKKWQVKVMDQSQVLSAYLENPDGVLGLDFFQEFSSALFDFGSKTLTLTRLSNQDKRPAFGNLRTLGFEVRNGHYVLNDIELERVSGDSVELSTQSQSYRIRVAFRETITVSKGEPLDSRNTELMKAWAESIPVVSEILKQKDAKGSLKPLVYSLIAPANRKSIRLREQLTLLWSADPAEKAIVGHTGFGPPMNLAEQLIDVQYRDLSISFDHSKVMLQILYIHDDGPWMTLGAFVIASKANGDYEFYLVPRSLLDQIVISKQEQENIK